MKHIFSYFKICIKRSLKCFVPTAFAIVLLIAVLLLTAQLLIRMDQNDVSRQRIKIGVVGDITGTHLGIGFDTLSQIDDISFSVEFIQMDEAQAEADLRSSNISAYVLVPDNYISDLVDGEDAVLTFVMTRSTADISAILMSEVAKIVSPLVTESESGIYAMIDYSQSVNAGGLSDKITHLNLKYITEILDRQSATKVELLGINSLSVAEYYACGIMTFFLLIFSVACCPMFADKRIPLGRLLYSKGMKTWQMAAGEYVAYTAVMWCVFSVICLGASAVCNSTELPVETSALLKLPITALPCILMISALHFFIYEITGSIISGVLAQFMAASAMGYISGCFYPYYMFPQGIQKAASVLPSGILFGFLRESMAMRESDTLIWCMAYAALFFMASVLVRRRRLSWEAI